MWRNNPNHGQLVDASTWEQTYTIVTSTVNLAHRKEEVKKTMLRITVLQTICICRNLSLICRTFRKKQKYARSFENFFVLTFPEGAPEKAEYFPERKEESGSKPRFMKMCVAPSDAGAQGGAGGIQPNSIESEATARKKKGPRGNGGSEWARGERGERIWERKDWVRGTQPASPREDLELSPLSSATDHFRKKVLTSPFSRLFLIELSETAAGIKNFCLHTRKKSSSQRGDRAGEEKEKGTLL